MYDKLHKSIVSVTLNQGSSQKTESMVTPVFATPILTTSWLA
uniref:Glycerol dehydrogenase n=1 Tax=Enterobacter cloacae TaxID=550 RepID=A0A2S1JHH7_ENTCL|nr:Glycerol dehydrogenase [Enterobacter cloacae]